MDLNHFKLDIYVKIYDVQIKPSKHGVEKPTFWLVVPLFFVGWEWQRSYVT